MENSTWSYCVGEKAKGGKKKFNVLAIINLKGFMDSYCYIWKKEKAFLLFVAVYISYTSSILVPI